MTQQRFSIPNKKQRDYPLRSKVFCGCCHHALSRIAQKTPFFMCRHSQADPSSRCYSLRVNADELEQAVFQTLKKQLELTLSYSTDGKAQTGFYVAERSEYERQVEALENDKQSLFERFVMGEIDMDTYKAEKAVYDEKITRTNNAFAAIATREKQKQEEQERQNSRGEIWSTITESTGLTPELTDLLIEKVMVYPDNRIDIIYKVKDLFE